MYVSGRAAACASFAAEACTAAGKARTLDISDARPLSNALRLEDSERITAYYS